MMTLGAAYLRAPTGRSPTPWSWRRGRRLLRSVVLVSLVASTLGRIGEGVGVTAACADSADGVTLSGRVEDQEGRPIVGARVSATATGHRRQSTRDVTTGSNGAFEFGSDLELPCALEAMHPLDSTLGTREALLVRDRGTVVVLVLRSLGSVGGSLRLPSGDTFSGDVDVHLTKRSRARVGDLVTRQRRMSIRGGLFALYGLSDGPYELAIVPAGLAWLFSRFEVEGGRQTTIGRVVLEAGRSVRGVVVDSSGRAIQRALVESIERGGSEIYTDDEGVFEIPRVPSRPVAFEVSRHDFLMQTVFVGSRERGLVRMALVRPVRIELTLTKPVSPGWSLILEGSVAPARREIREIVDGSATVFASAGRMRLTWQRLPTAPSAEQVVVREWTAAEGEIVTQTIDPPLTQPSK
jgi:hypothetical protein